METLLAAGRIEVWGLKRVFVPQNPLKSIPCTAQIHLLCTGPSWDGCFKILGCSVYLEKICKRKLTETNGSPCSWFRAVMILIVTFLKHPL